MVDGLYPSENVNDGDLRDLVRETIHFGDINIDLNEAYNEPSILLSETKLDELPELYIHIPTGEGIQKDEYEKLQIHEHDDDDRTAITHEYYKMNGLTVPYIEQELCPTFERYLSSKLVMGYVDSENDREVYRTASKHMSSFLDCMKDIFMIPSYYEEIIYGKFNTIVDNVSHAVRNGGDNYGKTRWSY